MRLEPTLPSRYYCDAGIAEQEWERIFSRSWLCAGREAELSGTGEFFTLTAGGENLLIVRGADGQLRAFHNVCRHRGSRLCEAERGQLKSAIRCPYHAWTYGLDGRLLGTPHLREGEHVRRDDFPLHRIGLEVWGGFIFINLRARAGPLRRQLGKIVERTRRYPLPSLRSGARLVHDVEANWKILVENYQECYHCPGIHPELCDLVPLYRTGWVDAPDGQSAYFRDGATTFTLGGVTRRPFLSGLGEDEKKRYNGELVLPNMFLNLFPDYVHTRVLWPLGPARTRIVSEWLFEPSTMARNDFDPSDAVDFLNLVGWQDWKVCEEVQKGVGSRAHRHGVYAPHERYAAGFKRWFLASLRKAGAQAPRWHG
jgi:Rieske 2Fe-2S family protein